MALGKKYTVGTVDPIIMTVSHDIDVILELLTLHSPPQHGLVSLSAKKGNFSIL